MTEACEASVSAQLNKDIKCDRVEVDPKGEAIILYPSFGAPLIVESNKPLNLIVLFNHKLYQEYINEHTKDPELTRTKKVICDSLKILSWSKNRTGSAQSITPGQIKCYPLNVNKKGEPDTAFPEVGNGRQKRNVVRRAITDDKGKLIGLLRNETGRRYMTYEGTFQFLFEIEITGLSLGLGLHDCVWKPNDPEFPGNTMQPPLSIVERQDVIARDFISANHTHVKTKNDMPVGYKIDGNSCDFTLDDDAPLIHHHVICVTAKGKLNIGQLTDIHVSSRQMTFKVCEAQVLPGANLDVSPKLNSVVNASFDTFKNLLDQMGQDPDVDVLVLTGDLIDFNQNFDPTATGASWLQDFKRPATMWQWMDPNLFGDAGKDRPPYPYFIDMVTIYSLLQDFVTRHQKPLIMLNGNHEAYDQPYGISPRVGQFFGLNPEGLTAANEGIPADHNFTVYEATLLYGPAYNDYRHTHNFKAAHLEWFYMMFNPLSDFIIRHGSQQSFTALSWNDSEQFLTNVGGGMLPRANEAVDDEQLTVLKAGRSEGQDRILLTHFTIVSYGYDYQLRDAGTPGTVNYQNSWNLGFTKHSGHMSNYEEGTFLTNREAVYDMLYHGAFTHVFSGHSHRAGYYVMTGNNPAKNEVFVDGYTINEEGYSPTAKLKGGKARMIVGASGGPIPGQNSYEDTSHIGLKNWSLDRPSGNTMNLATDTLKLKPCTLATAKPRFAVALSFFNTTTIEVNKNKVKGVFQTFESNKEEGEFSVDLHPALPDKRFIQGMTIYSYLSGWESYAMTVGEDLGGRSSGQRLKVAANAADPAQYRANVEKQKLLASSSKLFLAVSFIDKFLSTTGYKQYDFKTPWIFPIRLVNKREEAQETAARVAASGAYGNIPSVDKVNGYRVETDRTVPDFVWYQKNFDGYSTDKPTSPPIDKEPGYTR